MEREEKGLKCIILTLIFSGKGGQNSRRFGSLNFLNNFFFCTQSAGLRPDCREWIDVSFYSQNTPLHLCHTDTVMIDQKAEGVCVRKRVRGRGSCIAGKLIADAL